MVEAGSVEAGEIYARYISRGRPVAIQHATEGWPAAASLSRESFHATFATVEWQPQLLLPGERTVLAPYLEEAAAGRIRRPISFNRPTDPVALHAMQAHVRWPHVLSRATSGDAERGTDGARAGLDFFVGSNGSGTPLHHHSAVWNALVYGRKLWAFLPPSKATFGKTPKQHPLDSKWYRAWAARGGEDGPARRKKRPSQRYLYCEQEEGTLLLTGTQLGLIKRLIRYLSTFKL